MRLGHVSRVSARQQSIAAARTVIFMFLDQHFALTGPAMRKVKSAEPIEDPSDSILNARPL